MQYYKPCKEHASPLHKTCKGLNHAKNMQGTSKGHARNMQGIVPQGLCKEHARAMEGPCKVTKTTHYASTMQVTKTTHHTRNIRSP